MNLSEIGVIAGLDPAIQQLKNSSAGVWMDARVEPAHDVLNTTLCLRSHRTSTFLNCQGSLVSMSSGNSPGRSVSGVQSV